MSQVEYELFGDAVEAHMAYALGVGGPAANEIVRRRIEDGSWTRAPGAVTNAVRVLADRAESSEDSPPWQSVLNALAKTLTLRPLDDVAHRAVETLTYGGDLPDEGWTALAEWLVSRAGPGETSLVAHMVQSALFAERRAELVAPLAAWLLDNGASELRSRRHQQFVRQLVRHVLDVGDEERLALAVRYALLNEAPQRWYFSDSHNVVGCNQVVEAIDRLLERDSDRHVGLLAELVRAAPEDGPLLFATIVEEKRDVYPKVACTVVTLAIAGELPDRVATRVWPHIVARWRLPSDLKIELEDRVLTTALEAVWSTCFVFRDEGHWKLPAAGDADRGWMTVFVRSFLRHRGRTDVDRQRLKHFEQAVGHRSREVFAPGVMDALREHAATTHDVPPLLAALLASQQPDLAIVRAALMALTLPVADRAAPDPSTLLAGVAAGLASCLQTLAARPTVEALRGVKRVAFTRLDSDDKTQVTQDLLEIDRTPIAEFVTMEMPLHDQIVVGVQYVIHEAVHLQQGIGDKIEVARLRQAGAESTLMQIDLAADHLAAVVTAGALGQSLHAVKDLQGRSLIAYPASTSHTIAARARKANRLVGLRVDYLARRLGLLDADADEHMFADYGPGGGVIAFLASGPPLRLIATANLDRKGAEILMTAADASRELRDVDAVIDRCLGNPRQPRQPRAK